MCYEFICKFSERISCKSLTIYFKLLNVPAFLPKRFFWGEHFNNSQLAYKEALNHGGIGVDKAEFLVTWWDKSDKNSI